MRCARREEDSGWDWVDDEGDKEEDCIDVEPEATIGSMESNGNSTSLISTGNPSLCC